MCQVSENFYIQNTFCGSNSLLPRPVSSLPTTLPGAHPDTQLTCNCPLSLRWSHSYPPIHQRVLLISLWFLNPFSQVLLPSPSPIISPGLTNQPPQRTCSLSLTSINLVVILCLKPFHWFSLHLEIKSKLLVYRSAYLPPSTSRFCF